MEKYPEYASSVYGTMFGPSRKATRTQKAIASEVAVGDRSYYGVFRRLDELDAGADDFAGGDTVHQQRGLYYRYNNYGTLGTFNGAVATIDVASTGGESYGVDRDPGWWWQAGSGEESHNNRRNWERELNGVRSVEQERGNGANVVPSAGTNDNSGDAGYKLPAPVISGEDELLFESSCVVDRPLPLQMFISSLGDALSYDSSVDTATYSNNYYGFSKNNPPGPIYPNLNATPMGSTTKLITTDSSSTYKWKCCSSKCFPIFGTLFMTLSLTVSLGNILRLPTVVYLHGGGSFLVAYIAIAIFLGVPLLFLEITLGQFCQQGTTKLWRAVPLFKGVGFAKILSCILVGFYYPLLVVATLLYAAWAIVRPMPSAQCITKSLPRYIGKDETIYSPIVGKICSKNETTADIFNDELTWFGAEILMLLVFWIIVIFGVFRSAKSYRMSACIIVPISLFISITLFAEGIQRNMAGLRHLIDFKWENLLSFDLWYHALIQFFFSTHVGFGNITTCAGRLYPKNNPFWTSVSFILVNMMVGISFVCVVYMWIGDLNVSNKTIHMPEPQELFVLTLIYDVASSCYGQFSQVLAVVVFSLILLSGLTSMISFMYTIIVGIMVETKTKLDWWLVTMFVCFGGFIITCCCILPENFGTVKLLNNYVVGKVVVTTTVLEVIGFVWVYGLDALANDFEFVLGYKLNFIWKSLWFLTPLIITAAEIWSWFALSMEDVFHHKSNNAWLYMIGWLIYLLVWSIIIGIAVWQVSSQVDYNIAQKFISSIKPSRNWGPVDPIYRHCWVQWRKQYQATGERDFTLKRRGTRDYTHSVKRGKHAGPVGMRYSVNPSSNQNTLQYKMERDNAQMPASTVNTITSYSTWASCNTVNTTYK